MPTELPIADEPRAERCETCRFCEIEDGDDSGECHRFPPSPFMDIHNNTTGKASGFVIDGSFPFVDASDWCGEWQFKAMSSKAQLSKLSLFEKEIAKLRAMFKGMGSE